MERTFLDLVGYDLTVPGSEYAKYYFTLQTIAFKQKINFPKLSLSAADLLIYQNQSLNINKSAKKASKSKIDIRYT